MKKLLVFALVLILAGGFLAQWVRTDGYKIEVRDVRFAGADGKLNSALLYIPPGASKSKPAPGIVATHGYINSKETQDGFAIEFARRGFVVLAPDQPGHGFSAPPAFRNGFGGADTFKYMRSLDMVDPYNIGLEGHSMGGWASVVAAGTNPTGYKSFILAGSSTGNFGIPEGTPVFPRNLALIYSKYDEFSKLMWDVDVPRDIVKAPKLKKIFNTKEDIRIKKIYGNIDAGTARILYQPPVIHPRVHFSRESIGYAVDWAQTTLKGSRALPSSDQIWYWKELGTFIAMIGMVLLLFPLGAIVLNTKFFKELLEPTPESKAIKGFGWWVAALLAVLIPMPLFLWAIGYSAPGKLVANALFPQVNTTTIVIWAVGVAVVSLVLFFLWHLRNRKKGASFVNYGLTWPEAGINWKKIGKSLLLALIIAAGAYLTLIFSDVVFKTDYRLWIFAVKPMSALHFRMFLVYLIPLLFYFLAIGLVLHGQLRRTRKDGSSLKLWQEMSINVLLLVLAYVLFEFIQYRPLLAGGTLLIPLANLWFIIMFQFFPIFIIAALVMTYFYRKTGHVYVGSFLSAILVTWIIVAGQATHFAF